MDGATMDERFGDFDRRLGRVEQGLATLGAQVEGLDARARPTDHLPDPAFYWRAVFTANAATLALAALTLVAVDLLGRT